MMLFGILGPLQVRRDGAEVPLPGRTLRRLLAVLLLEAGHAVPLPTVLHGTWDDMPPGAARRRVQNVVSTLRHVLDDPDRRLVQSVGEGYRLNVAADQLDAFRFEDAVGQARRSAAAGDLPLAVATLREALGSWRGPALAGLTGRLIEAGARRWDEARLTAVEECLQLELALGHGPSVVAELRQLVPAHPDRHRLIGHLMRALHQDGRDAEALAVYDEFRRRLVEDQGLDPPPELADLQRAILRREPGLRSTPSRTPELPPDTPHFTGRDEQLSLLDRVTVPGPTPTLVVLSGIGGSGKTALAAHWSRRSAQAFDTVLYVDLRGFDRAEPLTTHEALTRLVRSTGGGAPGDIPPDVDQARARYRSLLAPRRALIVLDNARDADQVRPLLPGTPGSVTLVTSRRRLAGLAAREDAQLIPLGPLTAAESLRLLGSMVGEDRLAAEPGAAARLVAACAGLPLALRIASATLLSRQASTIEELAGSLSTGDRIHRLAVPGDESASLAAVFDLSYVALEPAEELLYLHLALLPQDDISHGLAIALYDQPPTVAERALAHLEAAHRLEQYRPGRYRFHDLVRDYARRKAHAVLDGRAQRDLRARVIDYYLSPAALTSDDHANVVAICRAWADEPGLVRLKELTAAIRDAEREPRVAQASPPARTSPEP